MDATSNLYLLEQSQLGQCSGADCSSPPGTGIVPVEELGTLQRKDNAKRTMCERSDESEVRARKVWAEES